MVDRVSALAGHYPVGHHGAPDVTGVTLEDRVGLVMHQVAAWPDTLAGVGALVASAVGAEAAPGPGQSTTGSGGTLLRVEPLKWWVLGTAAPDIDPEQGNTLDISHARTQLRIGGDDAATFLNRFLPLDLRDEAFPVGSVASSVIHHVGVTLWRSPEGYELFIPRGFALTLWEGFLESAEQFGVEVV